MSTTTINTTPDVSNLLAASPAPTAPVTTAASGDPGGGTTPPGGSSPASSGSGPTVADIAAVLSSELTAWVARIPDLLISHPLGKAQIRSVASIPIKFVADAVAAVESSTELQAANKLDLSAGHNAVDYGLAFEPVIKQLQKAATDLRYSAESKKALVATEALQVYDLSKALARDVSGAALVTFVDQMKKDLGRGKKKPTTTPPAPAPTTPPATPPPATPPAVTPTVAPTSVSMTATVPAGSTTTHS